MSKEFYIAPSKEILMSDFDADSSRIYPLSLSLYLGVAEEANRVIKNKEYRFINTIFKNYYGENAEIELDKKNIDTIVGEIMDLSQNNHLSVELGIFLKEFEELCKRAKAESMNIYSIAD